MALKQKSFIALELHNIKNFIRRLRTPSQKEYAQLLVSNFTALAAMGLTGYSIKFVHMVINKALSN